MKKIISILFGFLLITVLSACDTGISIPPTELPADSLFNGSDPSVTSPSNNSSSPAISSSNEPPPPATLTINGATQTAGIGTYCWSATTTPGESVQACVDKVGVPTALDPLKSSSPVRGTLTLPVNDPPTQLALTVFPASNVNEIKSPDATHRWWSFIEGYVSILALQPSQEIKQDLQPGMYVFYVFALWEGKGDVSYGFLVEVK